MDSALNPEDPTMVERRSDRDLVITRTFDSPTQAVFGAWTEPERLMRWWAPRSLGLALVQCDVDLRVGGRYRFVFHHPDAASPMAFFGQYLEATPPTRLVWTNEEGDGGQVTTVSFEERGGKTVLVMHDLYPSKEALDEAIGSGSTSCFAESFRQLDALLAADGRG